MIATASTDKTVALWSIESERLIQVFKGHEDQVTGVDYSRNGKMLASVDISGVVRVWSVKSGEELQRFEMPAQSEDAYRQRRPNAWNVAFTPNSKSVAAGIERRTALWSVKTGELMQEFRYDMLTQKRGQRGPNIECISFSPNGKILVTRNSSEELTLWDVKTGERIRVLNESQSSGGGNELGGRSVAFSGDGKTIASLVRFPRGRESTEIPIVQFWSVASGEKIGAIHQSMSRNPSGICFYSVNQLAFGANKSTIATISGNTLAVWSVPSGKLISSKLASAGNDEIGSMAFDSKAQVIAHSPSLGSSIELWSIKEANENVPPTGRPPSYIGSMAMSSDGDRLVSVDHSNDVGTITLWDMETGENIRQVVSEESMMFGTPEFSPGGNRLAWASISLDSSIPREERRKLRLLNLRTGEESRHAFYRIWMPRFSTDGKLVIAPTDYNGEISLWDITSSKVLRTFVGHTKSVSSIALSPDGSTLATGSMDRTVKLWSIETGEERMTFRGHAEGPSQAVVVGDQHDAINILVFHPDGKSLISGTVDGLMLWDVESGVVSQQFNMPGGRISPYSSPWLTGAVFSPDGEDNSCRPLRRSNRVVGQG